MGFSGGTQRLQYYQPSVSSDGRLFVHKPDSPHTDNLNSETPHYLNLDYELHHGTQLDYLFFESSKMLEGSEIQLLKNLCEQERTQILAILMLSMENSRLAGYMLTGNRSMFLSTDGSLAWLYHCPLMRSPPHVMNQCYDKIPIFYKNAIFFVDPITRQTYPDAQVQNCSDRIKNLFQFDMVDENSWFSITPTPGHRKRPAVFGPKDVTPVSRRAFGGAEDAGIYTRAQLSEFWDNILISAASRKALQKFSRELIVPKHRNSWTRTIFLLCSRNRLLRGQHDFPQLLQKSVYGHIWISCLCLGILWNIFLLLPVYQAHRWSHSHDLTTHGN